MRILWLFVFFYGLLGACLIQELKTAKKGCKTMTQNELREIVILWHDLYYAPYSKIAYSIGVSPQFIQKFVNGERNMSEETEMKLCYALAERRLLEKDGK